ncbi:MAG: hypothetical protein EBV03_09600, partial [Proteobacteria bacterium]|nr:hypothetical protein [Pseudomonadota bacterium]
SLLYYGFPFPNTKYAKLNTGISTQEYLQAGLYYFENLNVFDSFSCFIVFAALFAGCLQVVLLYDNRRQHSGLRLPLPAVLMAAGILLHMVYVVCVGGDFMAGRFFSVTFFQALMQLYVLLAPVTGFWLVSVAALLLWQWQARVDYTHPYDSPYCIVDARRAAGNMLSHLTVEPQDDAASNPSFRVENGRILAQKGHNTYCPALNSDRVILTSRIGVWGFFCGPKLHIIDGLALSDALLARLPSHQKNWCSGHFYRNIPMGYVHARRTNDTSYMQKDLREYYEKLRLVTSGDLFDPQRLRAIWGFLTGEYEELRQRYIEQSYLD